MMKEKEQVKRLKSLLTINKINNDYKPMSEEEISISTGIPLKDIQDSLKSAYSKLMSSGISEEDLKKFSQRERF